MNTTFTYHQGAERPEAKLWLADDNGALIDFSGAWTFVFKIGAPGQTAVLNKVSGITGAAGSGSAPSGTPNVTVAWAANDLNITPGPYFWNLTATTGGLDRVFEGRFVIDKVIA